MRCWTLTMGLAASAAWVAGAFSQVDPALPPPGFSPESPATMAPPNPSRPGQPAADGETALRLARSSDALTFHPMDGVILRNVRSPALTAAGDGGVIVVFDYVPDGAQRDAAVMCFIRSPDRGRTWSRPQPVRIEDAGGRPVRGRGGVLVRLAPRYHRLYFVEPARPAAQENSAVTTGDAGGGPATGPGTSDKALSAAPAPAAAVRSAVSGDGERFRLDDNPALSLPQAGGVALAAAVVESRVHLFATVLPPGQRNPAGETLPQAAPIVRHGVSSNGRQFDAMPGAIRALPGAITGILATDGRLRAFGADEHGVWSAMSRDGDDWTLDPENRMAGALEASVARLDDRTVLMAYTTALDDAARQAPELAMWGGRDDRRPYTDAARSKEGSAAEGEMPAGSNDAATGQAGGAATQTAADAALTVVDDHRAGDPVPASGVDAASGGDASVASRGAAMGGVGPDGGTAASDEAPSPAPGETAAYDDVLNIPLPNFETPVDYVAWYRGFLGDPADNAYPFYRQIIPNALDPEHSPPEWPTPQDCFNDADFQGPPAPWRPADHPAWEASRLEFADLREQFRQAAEHSGYAMDIMFSGDPADPSDGRPLLLELMLPALSYHRKMAKANLGQSWRMDEEGRVPPEQMLDAWRTTLRSAGHLHQGATLIEHLVGVAEQALVEMNARQALAQGVFESEADLERALQTLRDFDVGVDDPTRWIQGEYAMAMDVIQYLFSPADADGMPRLNPDRAEVVASMTGEDESVHQGILNMTAEDAHESIRAFTEHYRDLAEKLRIGYPQVRAGDLDDLETKNAGRTPLTRMLTPSLSRVHTLRTRNEASRRATQLSYALHLFQLRHGRWPTSLDELAPEFGRRMTIDPFTGQGFGYRLGPEGPTLYSLSENGLDDGGIHSPRWADGADEVGSDDHVFWPPQP